MDITVDVYAEKVSTGERRHTHTAHVVFVGAGRAGHAPSGSPACCRRPREERERYARAEEHRRRQKSAVTPAAITLVLSGGGAKTAAHIGAARAIEEAGLAPVRYVATSMGAVVAAALAGGRTETALLERLGEAGRSGRGPGSARPGARPVRPARCFAPSRFAGRSSSWSRCAGSPTCRCRSRSRWWISTAGSCCCSARGRGRPAGGRALRHLRPSGLFPAFEVAGRRCGDGGLRGPLPLDVAARLARETVVAVDVGPGYDAVEEESDAPAGMAPFAALRAVLASVPPVVRAHDDAVGALMAAPPPPRSPCGGRMPGGRRWCTCGPAWSATPPSGWIACAATREVRAIATRSRAGGLDPHVAGGRFRQHESFGSDGPRSARRGGRRDGQ